MSQGTDERPSAANRNAGRSSNWLAAAIGWRMRALSERVREARSALAVYVRQRAGFSQPETKLITDSQAYWNNESSRTYQQDSHWRGGGIFSDESRWIALGLQNLRIYEEFACIAPPKARLKRIVEWGCGGGMNAIHFGRLADDFCGIDIAAPSLEECKKQMSAAGLNNFTPILIDASHPEKVLGQMPGPCDLFICTYVFEILPSPEYGIRVLELAFQMLSPGGMALVQIKYNDSWNTKSRMWDYAKNISWNATYRIEEFWQAAQRCGFTPKAVTLIPEETLIKDKNYAYFLFLKEAKT